MAFFQSRKNLPDAKHGELNELFEGRRTHLLRILDTVAEKMDNGGMVEKETESTVPEVTIEAKFKEKKNRGASGFLEQFQRMQMDVTNKIEDYNTIVLSDPFSPVGSLKKARHVA